MGFGLLYAVFFAILGRVTSINYANPIPLRWSEAFVTGDKALGALGLNPVLYFYDTLIPASLRQRRSGELLPPDRRLSWH